MEKYVLTIVMAACLFLSGCGNLSPRLDQEIDNANGRIDNMETITNGVKSEIGTLQNHNDIQDSKIGQMQQGIANMQSSFENYGVSILSGSGGLMFAVVSVIGVFAMVLMVFHYRRESKKNEKTADILAQKIAFMQDPILTDSIFQAAMHTEVEDRILNIMKRHQQL